MKSEQDEPWTLDEVLAVAEGEAPGSQDADDPEATSAFLWCLHCERAFPKSRRPGNGYHGRQRTGQCWYRDCDGSWMDLWDWAQIRDANGYQEAPRPHVLYPQFGPEPVDPREPEYPYGYTERKER